MTPSEQFGINLQHKREELGLSLKELGEKAGVSPGWIQNWEAGHWNPRAEDFCKVADALGVHVHDLTIENVSYPEPLQRVVDKLLRQSKDFHMYLGLDYFRHTGEKRPPILDQIGDNYNTLSSKEVCEMLGLTRAEFLKLARSGQMPGTTKIGSSWKTFSSDLRNWCLLRSNRV
jgi:DNA-binding XRE family transcriptional regulator/predicted DNA-binding transcriptional regulator AlpA